MTVPAEAEAAAIAAAVEQLLAADRAAPDPLPAAYRSAWRRTALTPEPFAPPPPTGP